MSNPLVSVSKKVIKIQPTFTADDNADNDVAFDWTEIPNAFSNKGKAATLQSIFILNGFDRADVIELVFCRGGDASGTAPTSDQKLGVGSAVVDITQAETQEIEICGHVNIVAGDYVEGDLLTATLAQKTEIGLVMSPGVNSTSLYVGGIWRYDPADNSSLGTNIVDMYFGFED
tara:strand:- start:2125 stop:2646 length:522 start_codon:yes stop_codon:yes gene_type:complete